MTERLCALRALTRRKRLHHEEERARPNLALARATSSRLVANLEGDPITSRGHAACRFELILKEACQALAVAEEAIGFAKQIVREVSP